VVESVIKFILPLAQLGVCVLEAQMWVRVRHRREQVQILMEVLALSLNGVRVTRLMYRANLSYSTLRRYLRAMSAEGLICKASDSEGCSVYRATQEGRALLNYLRKVKDYLTLNAST
jgi:predicted transcriptional regulator